MLKNFKFKGIPVKDPRVAMRALIGLLLAANLAAVIVVFKPFGGSAEDLRRQQQSLNAQISQMQARLAASRRLVKNVDLARTEGKQFLGKYFMDDSTASAAIVAELTNIAKDAGIKMSQAQFNRDPIEGSDTLEMLSTQVGCEGAYANLTKFVNLLDKSPRFMIIESMQAAAPQSQGPAAHGQTLNVTLKIDTFVKQAGSEDPGLGAAPVHSAGQGQGKEKAS